MTVDVAVLTPTYLDYTFVGLEGLPGPGEERFAGDMVRSPGGGGIIALATARLGLSVALVAPLGDDLAGRYVRRALEEDGVEVGEPRGSRTPTTMVMPVRGDRAMVTVDPGLRARAVDVEPYAPRAIAATLEQIDLLPAGTCSYLTCGDDDARAFAGRLPHGARKPRALVVNQRESAILTGESDPAAAVAKLGEVAETAVVCLGPEGALASVDGRQVTVPGAWAEPVVDTPPAPRTCSSQRSPGPTSTTPSRRSRCAGPASTPACPSPRRPPPAAPSPATGCSKRARSSRCPSCRPPRRPDACRCSLMFGVVPS